MTALCNHVIDYEFKFLFKFKCYIVFCAVGKGECVQGSSGRSQQEIKERSPVSAQDAEWRLCHPRGGQGRPGGVRHGESNIPVDSFVNINVSESSKENYFHQH